MFIGQAASVSRFNYLLLGEGFFSEVGRSKKILSNGKSFIILRRQINFDRDQKAAAIDQTTGRDRLFGHP
jgi:hypothetical protein